MSRDISVWNRSQNVISFKTDYAIIDGRVSQEGTVVLLTRSERYNCQMEVYRNGKYERALTWYASRGFPGRVCVSDNGSLAAVARIVTEGGELTTLLTVIDLTAKAEKYEIEFPGITVDCFFSDRQLIAVTDTACYLVDEKGEVGPVYAFSDAPLIEIAHDEGQNLALAFGDNNQPAVNRIVILTRQLAERAVIEGCGTVTDMYLTSDRLYLLTERRIVEYTAAGKENRVYEVPWNTFAVLHLDGIIAVLPDRISRITRPMSEEP